MPSAKPNILCFVTDQHRADHVGCCGNPDVQTPYLDRLASEGVRFTESYVANPVCMPNRASLFTGRYPKAHRLRENGIALSRAETVLPDVLRRAGYQTASFGKIHLAPFGPKESETAEPWEAYESSRYWSRHSNLPLPYYGFETVYFVGGHGNYTFGHYKQELERDFPGAHDQLQPQHALRRRSGARESWKAAIPEDLHYNTVIAEKTMEYFHRRDPDRPFFVWCSFPDPHHPYSPPAPYCDQYDPAAISFQPARRPEEFDRLPPYFRECREGRLLTGGLAGDLRETTEEHFREILAHTYGMISMVDYNIGRVVNTLETLSLLDDTIIVFLSDHGDLMGDHWLINKGPFLFRGLVRVPTIWRVPGQRPAGAASSAIVSAVDFCPTVLDLAGVPTPEGVQGRSYKGVLAGDETKGRDWAYIEYDESYLEDRLRQLRSREWSLTYFAQHDYGMLYDLRQDPNELVNVWDEPDYQNTKRVLLAHLLHETADADDWLPPKTCHA